VGEHVRTLARLADRFAELVAPTVAPLLKKKMSPEESREAAIVWLLRSSENRFAATAIHPEQGPERRTRAVVLQSRHRVARGADWRKAIGLGQSSERLIMKTLLLLTLITIGSAITASARTEAEPQKMKITAGKRVFTVTLENSDTAAAFVALLPLTSAMHDVNRNEKAYDLAAHLPSADAKPGIIRTGDLMLWSSRTVVVFYKSFSTPYSYTRLGRIDDPAGLAEALGAGDVTVKFERS
jgi:hypothetical protein